MQKILGQAVGRLQVEGLSVINTYLFLYNHNFWLTPDYVANLENNYIIFIRHNSIIFKSLSPKSHLLSKEKKRYTICCMKNIQKNSPQSWWQFSKKSPWCTFSHDNNSLSLPMESVLEVTKINWNWYIELFAKKSDLLPYKHFAWADRCFRRHLAVILCYWFWLVFLIACAVIMPNFLFINL